MQHAGSHATSSIYTIALDLSRPCGGLNSPTLAVTFGHQPPDLARSPQNGAAPPTAIGLPCNASWVIILARQFSDCHQRQAGILAQNNQGEWMQAEEQPRSRARSALREFIETILFTLLIYFLVRTFLIENYRVVGRSMESTLQDDQFLVVNKLVYRLHEPQRGDIIVFRDPRNGERKLIKRVIGLPGEVLEIKNGQVFINDRRLQESYIQILGQRSRTPVPIPADQYFVMGDNRNNSSDSRDWGTLPEGEIIGKAWFTYWPPSLWGVVPHEVYEGMAP